MSNFQILSPIIDQKENFEKSVYRDAFDFVFNHDEIRNIAVSGAYGAGKSSVFNTYMHYWKDERTIMHISLARFKQTENCKNDVSQTDENSLEAKIINQLVHQIKPSRIRRTGFVARKNNNYTLSVIKGILSILGVFIATILLFFEKITPYFIDTSGKMLMGGLSSVFSGRGLVGLVISLFIIILILTLMSILTSTGESILKKISIKDFTIDFSENKENVGSYFDKYLSEIRYLFDCCKADTVAIEDIDRYVSSLIFEKIRELNTIVNYDREKPIRFFYIIKDDLFVSKDRTKFFDFIIPIVPIIDSSNSYSQLRTILQVEGGVSGLNNTFLYGLSYYIDDMRVLKNIVNEFFVYHRALEKQKLDPNRLLALLTYKNLFPQDFNDLQFRTGYLYKLIQSKSILVDHIINKNIEEIANLKQQIYEINNEQIKNLTELNTLYLKPSEILEIGGNRISSYESQLMLYKELEKNQSQVYGIVPNGNRGNIDIKKRIDDLPNHPEYKKRKQIIESKTKNMIQELQNKIESLETENQNIMESHKISALLVEGSIDEFLSTLKNENEKKYAKITDDIHFSIIPFLLRQGMIDGNYQDYLTYFYDNELKVADQQLIRSIYDEKPLPVSFELTNPKEVLRRLGGIKTNNPAFLVRDLFFYVFDNEEDQELGNFIKLSYKFHSIYLIMDYLENGEKVNVLIKTLNKNWATFFIDSDLDKENNSDKQSKFLQQELLYEESERLADIVELNGMIPFIEENKKILFGIKDSESQNFINNLNELGAELIDITSPTNDEELLNLIYDSNLYRPNVSNVSFLLNKKYGKNFHVFESNLLSEIFKKPNEPLCLYITNRLDDLINSIIENSPQVVFDDNQKTIHQILDTNPIQIKTQKEYSNRLMNPVDSIEGIEEIEVILILLERNMVSFSLDNILVLFENFNQEFTEEFKEYLSKHMNAPLPDKKVSISKDDRSLFIDEVLADDSLDEMMTTMLLSVANAEIIEQTKDLNESKAKALISSNALVLNLQNLEYLRKNHPLLVVDFQKSKFTDFLNYLKSGGKTNSKEVESLLISDLDGRKQISLLACSNVPVSYRASYKYISVKKRIIENFANISDCEAIIKDPAVLDPKLLKVVVPFLSNNIKEINTIGFPIEETLFNELKKQNNITRIDLIELFSNSIILFDHANIETNIRELEIQPFLDMYNYKRPIFQTNEVNQRILSVLLKKDLATLSPTNRLYRKKN